MKAGRSSRAKCSGPEASNRGCLGPPPSVVRRHLLERPKRNCAEELVPGFLVQAEYLLADRLVPWRKGREMGYEYRLQLHVGLQSHTFEQVGVDRHGVVKRDPTTLVPLEREIPDGAASSWV
eukprot:6212867-Pleurochrysis_carterae.AAC.2